MELGKLPRPGFGERLLPSDLILGLGEAPQGLDGGGRFQIIHGGLRLGHDPGVLLLYDLLLELRHHLRLQDGPGQDTDGVLVPALLPGLEGGSQRGLPIQDGFDGVGQLPAQIRLVQQLQSFFKVPCLLGQDGLAEQGAALHVSGEGGGHGGMGGMGLGLLQHVVLRQIMGPFAGLQKGVRAGHHAVGPGGDEGVGKGGEAEGVVLQEPGVKIQGPGVVAAGLEIVRHLPSLLQVVQPQIDVAAGRRRAGHDQKQDHQQEDQKDGPPGLVLPGGVCLSRCQ